MAFLAGGVLVLWVDVAFSAGVVKALLVNVAFFVGGEIALS